MPRGRAGRPLRELPLLGNLVLAWEDRLTPRGRYLFGAVAVFALVGLDTRRTQVYLLFALAVGVLLPALFYEAFPRPRARLLGELPSRVTAGTPVTARFRVEAAGQVRLDDLCLSLRGPVERAGAIRFRPRDVPLAVAPGRAAEVAVEVTAGRRGRYELRGPVLRAMDPLRLATSQGVALPRTALLAYPRFYSLESFDVPLGRRYHPGGIPLSSSTGDAIEFVGTREYRLGDPVRNLHWRSWARRGEPVVKEFQEEYFCRLAIVLDTFSSDRGAAGEAGFEAAVSVVASIADYFSRTDYVVDILAAGPDVYEVSAGRSLAYLENILDVLACLEPCEDPPFAAVGPVLFDKLAQITTVVAVLRDWDAAREGFLRRVRSLGTAVRAVIVRSGPTTRPWEPAVGEIGAIELLTPAEVATRLAAGSSSGGGRRG